MKLKQMSGKSLDKALKESIEKKDLKEATVQDKIDEIKKKVEKNPEVKKAQAGMGGSGNTEVAVDYLKGDIEETLDEVLEDNKLVQGSGVAEYTNLLIVGEAGVGKTSRVRAWAQRNGINLLVLKTADLDESDFGGIPVVDKEGKKMWKLANSQLDAGLDRPNSVLYLDEFNRGRSTVRGTLLTLIEEHKITDPTAPSGEKFFPNLLFTVATINPAGMSEEGADELGRAERSRFRQLHAVTDPNVTVWYIEHTLLPKLAANQGVDKLPWADGAVALAKKILTDKRFHFDTEQEIQKSEMEGNKKATSAREFVRLLINSRGQKDRLLNNWNNYCNSLKKNIVDLILKDYTDVDDKANDALKKGSQSKVFKQREKTNSEKIQDWLNSHRGI